MIIDNILSTLVQDHPDLLDTFEGGDWDKLVDGGYPEEVVIPVLRNIVEHALSWILRRKSSSIKEIWNLHSWERNIKRMARF